MAFLFFMMPPNFKTEAKIGSVSYKFALFNFSTDQLYNSKNARLIVIPASDSFQPCSDGQIQYKVGDTIYVGKNEYGFSGVTKWGYSIFLDSLGWENKELGAEEGSYAFSITAEDMLTYKSCNTDTIRKYILLDFWGTWCKPCLASVDMLRKINDKYKNAPFQLISIAKDMSEKGVKQFLKKEHIDWTNFFDDWNDPVISNKFKVMAYPTFILINPDGKIVTRITGVDKLSKIDAILSKKFVH